MADLVAVTMFPTFEPDRSLKREALLFDRVEVFGLSKLFEIAGHWGRREVFAEWEYLQEAGFLSDPRIRFVLTPEEAERSRSLKVPDNPLDVLRNVSRESIERAVRAQLTAEAVCRDYAGRLRNDGHADAVFIAEPKVSLGHPVTARDQVLRIALMQLPMPDESTPWDAIMSFKRDAAAMLSYRRLRYWMNSAASAPRTPTEIEDELLHFLSEYEAALNLHKIKTSAGVLETLVTTSLDVLGKLGSFQWGKAAKAVFDLRRQDMALREAELTAPGREVAYLLAARRRFGYE